VWSAKTLGRHVRASQYNQRLLISVVSHLEAKGMFHKPVARVDAVKAVDHPVALKKGRVIEQQAGWSFWQPLREM
jgi:hypothetical protein